MCEGSSYCTRIEGNLSTLSLPIRRSVPLVVVCHRAHPSFLERKAQICAFKRLDLAPLVNA